MPNHLFNYHQLRESRLQAFRSSTSEFYPKTCVIGYNDSGAILGHFDVAQFKKERQEIAAHKLKTQDRETVDVRIGEHVRTVSMSDVFKGKASPELLVELLGGDTRRRSDDRLSDLECMTQAAAEIRNRFERRVTIIEERQRDLSLLFETETGNMKYVEDKYAEEIKTLRLAIKHPLYAFSPYWRERFSTMRLLISLLPDGFSVPPREPHPKPFRLPEEGFGIKLGYEETNAKRARTS